MDYTIIIFIFAAPPPPKQNPLIMQSWSLMGILP